MNSQISMRSLTKVTNLDSWNIQNGIYMLRQEIIFLMLKLYLQMHHTSTFGARL